MWVACSSFHQQWLRNLQSFSWFLVWQHHDCSLMVWFLVFHQMLRTVCVCVCAYVLPLSSFIFWAILCTDRALIDLAVDMASRVWCRSFKATRKNAQNIPGKKKKKSAILALCGSTRWTHCSDLLWFIDNRLVTLTYPRLRFPRDIFNIQTTHCSSSAVANLCCSGATTLRNRTPRVPPWPSLTSMTYIRDRKNAQNDFVPPLPFF